jgi:uncharacterized protein with PIN domain
LQVYHTGQYATQLRRREADERRAERDLLIQVLSRFAPAATVEPESPEAQIVEKARERLHEIEDMSRDSYSAACAKCEKVWSKPSQSRADAAVRMHVRKAHAE